MALGAPVAAPTGIKTDYGSLLANDPQLKQTLAGINAQGETNKAQLQSGQNRAVIQYGGIPSSLAGQIDPTTAGLAQAATSGGVSTLAGLARGYQGANAYSNESLAARGMLRSGETGQRADANLSNYNQAGYKAGQDLEDYLAGLRTTYLQTQDQLRQQGVAANQSALDRIISQINAGTLGGQTGSPVDTTFAPPRYGSDAGYAPNGSIAQNGALYGNVAAPGGAGVYRSGGGRISYQSAVGNRKPLY